MHQGHSHLCTRDIAIYLLQSMLHTSFAVQKELNLDWYSNISKLTNRFGKAERLRIRLSTSMADNIRKEFVKHWKASKEQSPKLEFYNLIKTEFGTEEYLSLIENPSHRASVTRLRISSHNLYIERGRYETPLVPREDRWCAYCYTTTNQKLVESESHVLLHCPLFESTKVRTLLTEISLPSNITDLFEKIGKGRKNNVLFGEMVHDILELNQHYTTYYNSQDFHSNTGDCVVI